jgi:hypothetical protein
MHIRNYERPEGWSKGHPEVLVAPPTAERLGMPLVDYDSLHQFLTDDIGVPYDAKTSIRLYGRDYDSRLLGFHAPYTRTVHVNSVASEERYRNEGGTMRVLAHEAMHRADSTNRKLLTAVEIGARAASFKIGYEVVETAASAITSTAPYISTLALYGGLKTRRIYYKHEPAEKRARSREEEPATLSHQTDILFPRSSRTYELLHHGLPLQTIRSLGLPEYYEQFASDIDEDEEGYGESAR